MKYFVLGALASGMLLYGLSMVYGATTSLDLQVIAGKLASGSANTTLMVFGLVFIVTGLGFKLGVVPFHMWVPDVYQGSPTAVTMLIGSASKLAALALVLRLLAQGMPQLAPDWQKMLLVLAVLSIGVGNVVAIAQTNIKRMFAYSTISHMGFLLLGLIGGGVQGYAAAMFYAMVYALMAAAGFGMVMLLSRPGFEADRLSDFKGLAKRSPWYALMLLCVLFSMAGIPVFSGFFAKLWVIQSVVAANLVWLAVYAVLFSLVGALETTFDQRVLLSANALVILLIGLMPNRLLELCYESVRTSLKLL
jgi:NADH-quinone oxidoreductase subunit N